MTMQLPTTDSLRALVGGMGPDPLLGKGAGLGQSHYLLDDVALANAYRNGWLPRKIVDIPALDALRKWRSWQAEQTQITAIEDTERRLGLKQKLLQNKIMARLWGGSALFIGTDQDPAEPLDPETIGKDGLRYLTVLNRRELISDELEQDPISEQYGMPRMYTVSNGREWTKIHPTRMVIQVGAPLPDVWHTFATYPGWGDSVLQAAYTAILNAETTAANIAALVFEANIDVFKVPGLMEYMADPRYRTKLLDRFTLAQAGKSISKSLLTDSEEEYERNTISFAGLPDVIQQFLIIVSGAADIPLTRLLGQSPAGLNSTGEHDMKNYHDRVQSIQQLEIDPATHRLNECLIRSALGSRPAEVFYTWNPLEQMSEKEQAEIAKLNAETSQIHINGGLFQPEELREVVGNQLVEHGVYPGLGDLLQANGMELEEFDLEREAAALGVEGQAIANTVAQEPPDPEDKTVKDAADNLRTLYVARPVMNARQIINHYVRQGLTELLEPSDLHITIIYSKMPVDWMKLGDPWEANLTLPPSNLREHAFFGPTGAEDTLVLRVNSMELKWRHEQALSIGATTDHGDYKPHVTLKLGFTGELDALEPWTGPIELGPEEYEEARG